MEPWKVIICDSDECLSQMFVPENMKQETNNLTEDALKQFKIFPEIDNETLTQFTCPRCGKITTWGITRRVIAKKLYERYNNV